MILIFPYWGIEEPDLAEIMVRSVRKEMPGLKVIQQTDEITKQLPFVDGVWRKKRTGDFIEHRFGMLQAIEEETISLDYDVIVNKDLRHVFKEDFDLALTLRKGHPEETRLNSGVMFLRPSGNGFWEETLNEYQSIKDGWQNGQTAKSRASLKTNLNILYLDANLYNYPPRNKEEDISMKYVAHYKGKRKEWMRG